MSCPRRVFIIPGNGGGDILASNWYKWVRDRLNDDIENVCVARNMPQPEIAPMALWLPFMFGELGIGENDVIVGHSSGACAAVRFAERHKVFAIVLVGAYVSDLGIPDEKESGYFDTPWDWEAAKQNCPNIIQYGSTDDPFLPWDEQQKVADNLDAQLFKFHDRGHFMNKVFPELVKTVKGLLEK